MLIQDLLAINEAKRIIDKMDPIKEDETVTEDDKRIEHIVREIGKKHNVDFEDADGKQALSGMIACYKRGMQDGFNM